MPEAMRLQKFLSRAGVASRRHAETMIREGRVRVNGVVVDELGAKVDPEADAVEVDGGRVRLTAPVWIALYKPPGYVSTRHDPQGRPTLYDLVPDELAGLFYVGRLDRNSEGLVLLTNQGDIAHRLLHPRYEVDRVYEVDVGGDVPAAAVRRLLDGIELEDGTARAQSVEHRPPPAPGATRLRITLREGRKREVRRLFRALGYSVRRLVRLRYGPIRLGKLEPGRWRRLSRDEVGALTRLLPSEE